MLEALDLQKHIDKDAYAKSFRPLRDKLDSLQRVNQIKDDGDLLGRRCLIIPL